ncbi:hypothetical protein BaRGS_00013561 [Batillaria attramentaria]|uniref:ATP synthase-coupling factor 6, mitochondrial n=1 Tax=Batillaria attramentaria TaxID=370345 RepID=A0ABD0L794_9CAEN
MFRALTRLGVVRHITQHARRNIGFTAVAAQEAGKGDESAPAEDKKSGGPRINDPIQKLFLEKIREYRSKSGDGKLVDATPEIEARLKGELDKVDHMFKVEQGQDMTKFPRFDFPDPEVESINLGELRDVEAEEVEEEFEEMEEDNKPYFAK